MEKYPFSKNLHVDVSCEKSSEVRKGVNSEEILYLCGLLETASVLMWTDVYPV